MHLEDLWKFVALINFIETLFLGVINEVKHYFGVCWYNYYPK
jgi:hypothetical protein